MKGFTLLEILIASAILSLVMAGVYSAYTTNLENIAVMRENGEIQQTARMIIDRMTLDLRSAFPGAGAPFVGVDQRIRDESADRIDFVTTASFAAPPGSPPADFFKVGYYMVASDAGEEGDLTLYRRQESLVGDGVTAAGLSYELTKRVSALEIRYQDGEGQEHENWEGGDEDASEPLPSLVTVRLTLKTGDGKHQTFMTSIHPELAGGSP